MIFRFIGALLFISLFMWMLTTSLNFFQIERQAYFIYVLWICSL